MNTAPFITLLSIVALLTSCAHQSTPQKEAVTIQKLAPEISTPKETPKTETKKATLKTYTGLASWYSIKTNHGRITDRGSYVKDRIITPPSARPYKMSSCSVVPFAFSAVSR